MQPIWFPSRPQRILIIKPSAVGDIVHALPILNLVRQRWPHAHISWLVTPACAGLLEGHPMLQEVILFERRRFGKGWRNPMALIGLAKFTRDLRRHAFDLVIDLQGLLRSGWLSWKTRAAYRVGFADAREMGWAFYTHRVPVDTWDQHAIGRYMKIAHALGCPPGPIEFPFAHDDADRKFVRQTLAERLDSVSSSESASLPRKTGGYAVLLPGTVWPSKRWPIENFAKLIEPIRKRFGLECIVAGGPEDVPLARQLPAPSLAGLTTLRQLCALLEGAELVIANDTGPMHIAAALGRPLVALFGPTSPLRHGPFAREDAVVRVDIACSPCYSRTCIHQSCLKWLQVEPVLQLAERQLMRYYNPQGLEVAVA